MILYNIPFCILYKINILQMYTELSESISALVFFYLSLLQMNENRK